MLPSPPLGTPRVVGSVNAMPHEFPFIASLRGADGENFCSGTLIHPSVVLTAAHCVEEPRAPDRRFPEIHVGQYRRDGAGEQAFIEVRASRATVVHSGYNNTLHSSDIALLRLDEPVRTKPPIARMKGDVSLPVGTPLEVAGWGSTTEAPYQPADELRVANVSLVDLHKCGEGLRAKALLPGMLCAASAGADSCEGDSGGPLILHTEGEAVQVGIVSWGVGCARAEFPGIYTSVAFYSDWIEGWVRRWELEAAAVPAPDS